MEIFEYTIEPAILIGIVQILLGAVRLICTKQKIIADGGSFVNTGTNSGSVHIDNSQKEHIQNLKYNLFRVLFIIFIIVGLALTLYGFVA